MSECEEGLFCSLNSLTTQTHSLSIRVPWGRGKEGELFIMRVSLLRKTDQEREVHTVPVGVVSLRTPISHDGPESPYSKKDPK